jgi:hypothetical protein
MRLLRNLIRGVLALAVVAAVLAPWSVFAEDGERIDGAFTVTFMRPSALSYCPNGGLSIEAQGIGNMSKLGPLFLTVKKCLTRVGDAGTFAGVFKMTAGNGDTAEGTYIGTQDFALRDENGFGPFQGTLTFTGGTGSFKHASGALSFKAVASPVSVGVTAPTVNGNAFYLVRGTMSSADRN